MHTPILFLVFNRPYCTYKVFEKIKLAKPKKLYIVADGPRSEVHEDIKNLSEVKKIVTRINWPCKIKTIFRKKNLGVKKGPPAAITWFFKHEKEGIILEDDCVPNLYFFTFCEKLLNYYRNDKIVFTISGSNIKNNLKDKNESYHFSKYFHPWGWATWRRAWRYNNSKISFWPKWKKTLEWKNKMPINAERVIFQKIFDWAYLNKRVSWDYPFMASILKRGGLTVRSNINLINNIGYGINATHTINLDKLIYPRAKNIMIKRLKHPNIIIQDKQKDLHMCV